MSNLIQTAVTLYNHKGEIIEAACSVIGGLGVLASIVSHNVPLPAKWAERLARFSAYTSQRFSVNDRKPEASK